jgi:[ribosomal protein S5]-alanine N-acetyltransferase
MATGNGWSERDVVSPRLCLRLLGVTGLEAIVDGDRAALSAHLGLAVPEEILQVESRAQAHFLNMLLQNSDFELWSPRVIALRESGGVVGNIGFHTAPGPEYLKEYVEQPAIEMGYTVLPPHRGRGYALEAISALIRWAHVEQQVVAFVVSVGETNAPSLALAKRLGFTTAGTHDDDVDGAEVVFSLTGDALARLVRNPQCL